MPSLMVSVSGVRGIVGPELNPLVVSRWAASFAELLGAGLVVVGRDSRITGETLADAAIATLRGMGCEVRDLGIVPTPTVQLATEHWGARGGLILSASHNPAHWNALKFVDGGGSFLLPERFAMLRAIHDRGPSAFAPFSGYGALSRAHDEALQLHLDSILRVVDVERIRAARLTVWVDTGHGAGGVLLPSLAEALGVRLIGRRLEPTGAFPENPEPTAATLRPLMGDVPPSAAFAGMSDPDADRFAMGLPLGGPGANAAPEVVGEEWTLPLVAAHLLAKRSGPLVTNLSTSTRLEAAAERYGATVFRAPVGEAHVVGAMKTRGAVLGGEGNGGIIDPAIHFGRDAAVAFARLCEAEATVPGGLRALAETFPPRFMLKDKIAVSGAGVAAFEGPLTAALGAPDDRRDGLRWSRPDGFVHVRASATEPIVRAVVEAGSETEAADLIGRVRAALGTTG